jgi:biotin carboxylase
MRGTFLFIGGSHTQRLAVRSLCDWGFEVHVTDREPNPPCEAETDYVHRVDATDVSALVALAESLSEAGSFVGAYGIADYAMPAVAAINWKVGKLAASPEAIEIMIDKDATKDALRRGGLPLPETVWAGAPEEFDPDACQVTDAAVRELIVKPADVHASRGIARVDRGDRVALRAAVKAAGEAATTVLVEEFFEGDIWNADALVVDGVAHPVSVTRRTAHPSLAFLPSLQVQPRRSDDPSFAMLAALVQPIADSLGYANGPFTADLIMTEAGPKLLEVSPHFHSIAMELLRANGNPLRAWARRLAGEGDWQEDLAAPQEAAGALAMLRATECGRLVAIDGEDALANDPRCSDYIRMKPDGSDVASLSAAGGLLALAWWSAPDTAALESGLSARIDGFQPRFEKAARGVMQ